MTREQLYKYMKVPSSLNTATVEELRLLVDAYPFCSTFIFLYLYNLALIDDLRYHSELKRLSVFIPDRAFLYQLIEDAVDSRQWDWCKTENVNSSFSIVDQFLDEVYGANNISSMCTVSDDYFQSIGIDELNQDNGDIAMNDISSESNITYNSNQKEDSNQNDNSFVSEDDTLLTETLARIYIKQQKYDKALRIIRSISLHYPEKNAYFADQIRFLERVINKK